MHHHTNHWGFQAAPFENVPDPEYYFPSEKHEEARQRLLYGIQAKKGAVMLTGEIGCGKTLLSRALILDLPQDQYDIALVTNPALPPLDFLTEILYQFGLETTGSKAELIHRLNARLLENQRKGLDTVLVVDEAQSIPDDYTFEDLRLLLNFQLNNRFLMTIVLLGQPELKGRVEGIPQLAQRIAVRYHLEPFSAEETRQYIRSRLKTAGTSEEVFTKDAVFEIVQRTRGVSRLINGLCDTCLFLGAQAQLREIDASVVGRAARLQ